jgi:hypothetical protein
MTTFAEPHFFDAQLDLSVGRSVLAVELGDDRRALATQPAVADLQLEAAPGRSDAR